MERRFVRDGRQDAFPLSAEFPAWQDKARSILSSLLGLQYLEAVPLSPVMIEAGECRDGIRMEKLSIAVEDGVRMPFYLLIPGNAGKNTPIVIAAPGHQGGGKESVAGVRGDASVERMTEHYGYDYGMKAAENGMVAVCFDQRGTGERREGDEDILGCSCLPLSRIASSLGIALAGLFVWDVMRLVDYIILRGEWNTGDIRMVGFSGGGMQTLYTAALDERIGKAFISGYFYGFRDSLLRMSGNCSCNYIPSLWRHFDIQDIAAMIAPRPLIIQSAEDDHLNGERGMMNVLEPLRQLRELYAMLGAERRLVHDVIPGGHHFSSERMAELFEEAACSE